MTGTRVVFVYNADGGVFNGLRDVWHRVTSPSTYPSALCKVTYGVTGMDRRWRQFTASLELRVGATSARPAPIATEEPSEPPRVKESVT